MVGGRKKCNRKKRCFIYHEEIDGRIKSWAARWMYVRWMDGGTNGCMLVRTSPLWSQLFFLATTLESGK